VGAFWRFIEIAMMRAKSVNFYWISVNRRRHLEVFQKNN